MIATQYIDGQAAGFAAGSGSTVIARPDVVGWFRLLRVCFSLVTDANVVNRYPLLTIQGAEAFETRGVAAGPTAHTASLTANHTFMAGYPNETGISGFQHAYGDGIICGPNQRVILTIGGGTPGDVVSNVRWLWERL